MDMFDNALVKIYNFFETTISGLEKVIGKSFIKSVQDTLDTFHASALLISAGLLFLSAIIAYSRMETDALIILIFVGPLVLLLLNYLGESFHDACEDLISSNPTSISNYAYLRLSGVLTFLTSVAVFIFALKLMFDSEPLLLVAPMFVLAIFALLNTVPLFNPDLVNLRVDTSSSSAEDLVAIFSFNIKATVFLQKIFSRIFVLIGGCFLIYSLFETEYLFYGLGSLAAGVILPVAVYLFFIIFYFLYALLLAILAIPRINKS
tara:strand:+ start:138 stop:926 length:789 start_codon:yes stop_codon:yes gene_type:complete